MDKPEWMSEESWQRWKAMTDEQDKEWAELKAFGESMGLLPLIIPSTDEDKDNG